MISQSGEFEVLRFIIFLGRYSGAAALHWRGQSNCARSSVLETESPDNVL